MKRPLFFLAALCLSPCAWAQLTLSTAQGPVSQSYDFGPVAAGDLVNTVFTLTNTGTEQIFFTYLSVNGSGFSNPGTPVLPIPLAPLGAAQFTVEFQPTQPGSYSANLQINQDQTAISVILVGTGLPGFTVSQSGQPLTGGQTVNFGNVQTGTTKTLTLTLMNPNQAAALTIATTLSGSAAFSIPASAQGSTVAGGASAPLAVVFAPTATGPQQATLSIGAVSLNLVGNGTAPAPPLLPQPSIQLNPASLTSAQQGTLAVSLASASANSGSGTVTLAFQSAVSGVTDDPAVAFADGTRSATFTVAQGATAGQFSGGSTVQFGTGSTAGALAFTVTLGANTAHAAATIAPSVIGIDASVITRNVACIPTELYCTTSNLQVQLNGYDNTRSTSQIAFTFFGSSGQTIAPGNITVDGTQAFEQYFAGSTLGGVFGLSAFFPVTGDSNQVTAATIVLTNSAGTATTQRINF